MTTSTASTPSSIGAGHAGLAVSRLLTLAGREHVVLDRGRVGERWRSERWDSLHLLTPSWLTRLPGWDRRVTRTASCRPPVRRPARAVRRLVRRTGRDRCDGEPPDRRPGPAPTTCTRTTARGAPARSSSPPGPTARPWCRTPSARADVPVITTQPVPQPPPSGRRWRPGGGRLRRRGCRSPTSSPGRGATSCCGRAAHPDAAQLPRDGRLLVAGGHRPARTHDRRDARPCGRAP